MIASCSGKARCFFSFFSVLSLLFIYNINGEDWREERAIFWIIKLECSRKGAIGLSGNQPRELLEEILDFDATSNSIWEAFVVGKGDQRFAFGGLHDRIHLIGWLRSCTRFLRTQFELSKEVSFDLEQQQCLRITSLDSSHVCRVWSNGFRLQFDHRAWWFPTRTK